MRLVAFPALCAAIAAMLTFAAPAHAEKYPVAVFSGLDKITARVTSFAVTAGVPHRYGALEVTVRACDKAPPEEPPQTSAYVEVHQVDPGTGEVQPHAIFKGWMFAESPGLNALEHPVYDLWVTDCRNSSGGAPSGNE
ncbi:DUF2155 domain-containing protein [Parvibaculum sp.]|uniref:DUF2155 domain-containing protein n=1 Tax=Parvibaculum sp. TaxID=2024848 RepID=UPI001DB57F82|nr:DUF2155 domain-containing protein [Parvibaculum sp.]MBX3491100.1 DUF2155 domain-containing protein [Parvibaculum sp.]MCW5728920.1 DUF2155 domain-containing protein [Parvibaculum sp.]